MDAIGPGDRAIKRFPAICPCLVLLLIPILVLLFGSVRLAHGRDRFYSLQVGAFQEIKSAERMAEDLKKLGHNAFYREESIKGRGLWYRVYIEQFPSKEKAEKEGGVLRDLGLISDYRVRIPGDQDLPTPSEDKGNKIVTFLHIGSFKGEDNAEKMVDTLVSHGYKAFYVVEEVSGEKWHRVYLGEFVSEEEARKSGETLRERGLITYFNPIVIDKKPVALRE